jgi:hypothetical protein
MTKEDDDYRQGRRKEQMKATYIGAFIGIVGLLVITIYLLLFK